MNTFMMIDSFGSKPRR